MYWGQIAGVHLLVEPANHGSSTHRTSKPWVLYLQNQKTMGFCTCGTSKPWVPVLIEPANHEFLFLWSQQTMCSSTCRTSKQIMGSCTRRTIMDIRVPIVASYTGDADLYSRTSVLGCMTLASAKRCNIPFPATPVIFSKDSSLFPFYTKNLPQVKSLCLTATAEMILLVRCSQVLCP